MTIFVFFWHSVTLDLWKFGILKVASPVVFIYLDCRAMVLNVPPHSFCLLYRICEIPHPFMFVGHAPWYPHCPVHGNWRNKTFISLTEWFARFMVLEDEHYHCWHVLATDLGLPVSCLYVTGVSCLSCWSWMCQNTHRHKRPVPFN